MRSLDDIFRAFGGPSGFGRALGISTEHAAAMKRRKSIPARHWLTLAKEAKARGIALSLEELARVHFRNGRAA